MNRLYWHEKVKFLNLTKKNLQKSDKLPYLCGDNLTEAGQLAKFLFHTHKGKLPAALSMPLSLAAVGLSIELCMRAALSLYITHHLNS